MAAVTSAPVTWPGTPSTWGTSTTRAQKLGLGHDPSRPAMDAAELEQARIADQTERTRDHRPPSYREATIKEWLWPSTPLPPSVRGGAPLSMEGTASSCRSMPR